MDSGISPDSGMSDSEVCVPIGSLSIDGETPQVGDTVDFAIEARVTRIDGEDAYVTPEKVNGQEVTQDAASESDSEDSSEPSFSDNGDYMGQ
jgi:hypothetical protein